MASTDKKESPSQTLVFLGAEQIPRSVFRKITRLRAFIKGISTTVT